MRYPSGLAVGYLLRALTAGLPALRCDDCFGAWLITLSLIHS
jgi:hypothetical protein